MQSVPFCCFFSRNAVWRYLIIPFMSLLCWDHHHTLTAKPDLVSAMAGSKNWRLSVWPTAKVLALYEPVLLPDYIRVHTHLSTSVTQDWFYTSAMHIQCFSPSNRNIYQDVNQILHIPVESSPVWAHSEVLHVLVVVYGLSISIKK